MPVGHSCEVGHRPVSLCLDLILRYADDDMKVHKYSDTAFSIYSFMSNDECKRMIRISEERGFEEAKVDDGLSQQVSLSVRNNSRIIFDDEKLAMEMWIRVKSFVPMELDGWVSTRLNERFRFYKYDKFQSFKWHRDLPYKPTDNEMSKLTFMIYLNDDFEGGYTDFEDFKIWPQSGMAAIFNHKLRHEGSTVSTGTKYVLRSDVIYTAPSDRRG